MWKGRFFVIFHSRLRIGPILGVRVAREVETIADIPQGAKAGFFHFMNAFLDLLHGIRTRFFDLVREPISFHYIEDDNARHYDKEQRNADLLIVAEDRLYRAAEEISDAAQDQDPQRATDRVKNKKSDKRHLAGAVEHTHRDAYTVDVF